MPPSIRITITTLDQLLFFFQFFVAILFVIIGGLNINEDRDHQSAVVLNDMILLLIFLISIINIIISGFGLDYASQPLKLLEPPVQQIGKNVT